MIATGETQQATRDPQGDGILPLYRGLDWFVVVLAAGTIGFHLALLLRGGLVVFAVASVAVLPMLVRFVDLGSTGRRNTGVVAVDQTSRAGLYGAAGLVAVATIVAVWPGPPKGLAVALTVSALLLLAVIVGRPAPGPANTATLPIELLVMLGSAAALVALAFVWTGGSRWLLAAFVAFFAAVAASERLRTDDGWPDPAGSLARPVARPSALGAALVLAAAGVVLAVLVASLDTFNADNFYYVRQANVLAESLWHFPTGDVVHGLADAPHVPAPDVYQAQEAFVALAARIGGIGGLPVILVGVAPLVGLLAPFALARFAQTVGSRRPTLVAVFACAVLIGSRSLVSGRVITGKVTQGKGIFMIVLLPILLSAAADYWERQDPARLRFLLVAAVASMGVTVSASALVLPVLFVALIGGGLRDRFGSWRGSARPALSLVVTGALVLYPLVIAALGASEFTEPGVVIPSLRDNLTRSLNGLGTFLPRPGDDWAFAVSVSLMLLGLAVIPRRRLRLYLTALFALVVIVALNPLLLDLASGIADATRAAWRFGWLFPSAALMAVAVDVLSTRVRLLGMVAAAILLAVALTLGQTSFLTNRTTFPDVDLRARIPQTDWDAAAAIRAATEPDDAVLVPLEVGYAITMRYTDRHSIYVRSNLLKNLGAYPSYKGSRVRLSRLVSEPSSEAVPGVARLAEDLDNAGVDAACVPDFAPENLRTALAGQFEPVATIPAGECELWRRS